MLILIRNEIRLLYKSKRWIWIALLVILLTGYFVVDSSSHSEKMLNENGAFRILSNILSVASPLIIPLFIMLLGIVIFSYSSRLSLKEIEFNRNIPRYKLLLAKCLTLAISVPVLLFLYEFVTFILTGLLFGWKGGHYPIEVNSGYGFVARTWNSIFSWFSVSNLPLGWIPRWRFLLLSSILLAGISLVVAFISAGIASMLRSKTLSALTGAVIILGGYLLNSNYKNNPLNAYNFMQNANPFPLLSDDYPGVYSWSPNLKQALEVMLLWGLAALVILWISFRKQENAEISGFHPRLSLSRLKDLLFSIRWKLILVFALSILAALVMVLLLYGVAVFLNRTDTFKNFFTGLSAKGYDVPILFITGFTFFVIAFFILTQRTIRYVEEISQTLHIIADGHLDTQVPVKSSDELGRLAGDINRMTEKIKNAVEEEREAERTKTELITSVSHDLRTPLTSILGYLELLIGKDCNDEVLRSKYLEITYEKSIRLKKLIEDLFEYTRISSGGMKIRMQIINLGELLSQLTEEFFPVLQEKEMSCRLSVPKEKILVQADGDLMMRVFENLMSNALRYGSEGKYLDLILKGEEKEALVQVVNYGNPIPAEELPHIFEKFYRVEKSRSEDTGGTGLGLAIAKSILELNGGKISAYSTDEKTVFEVRLCTLPQPPNQ